MATSIDSTLTKFPKLNGENYHEWHRNVQMILVLKDMWATMQADIPPAEHATQRSEWKRVQNHALAIIHLSCELDQTHLIADATTAHEAWEILAETYTSTDISNIMRLEDNFGQAKKKKQNQSIQQWISYIRSLATQLRAVGVQVNANRVSNRILSGLGRDWDSIKAALRARPGLLTVEIVSQHLLFAEAERKNEETTMPAYTITPPYQVTAMPTADSNEGHTISPTPPYQRKAHEESLQCYACGVYGHTQNKCWLGWNQ